MINEITGLISRTEELEKYLEKFEKQQTKNSKKNVCLDFSRNYSNLEVILPKKVLVARVNAEQGSSFFIQAVIDFTLSTSETVEFSLSINDISIYKVKKTLGSGSNQISIMSSFVPVLSEEVEIFVTITPQNQKQLLLSSVTMFVWGDFDITNKCEYEILETSDKYLLTLLYNNIIYYRFADKLNGEYTFSDFSYLAPAIDYSVIYDENNDSVVTLRIDENGNLFYSSLLGGSETLLIGGTEKVSASISPESGKILVAVIKNKKCKYFEISGGGEISLLNDLKYGNHKITDCYVFYNSHRQKFCVILTAENLSNYYAEEIDETTSAVENISASYSINVSLENS